MKKLLFILCLIIYSCGEDEELGNVNNNIPPNQPNLITPSNNSTVVSFGINDPIYFEWTNVSDPDDDLQGYTFYISEYSDFNTYSSLGTDNNFIYLNNNSSTPSPTLYPNTTYYWDVEARDLNGNVSYSQTWSFYLEDGLAPTTPQLVFPLHETECSNDNLTFEWNESTDPSGNSVDYKLHISTSPSFDNNVDIYATSNTSYNVDLPQSTAFYWKVEAINTSNNSSFSETRSLYTQGDGVTNTIPQIEYLYPEDGISISNQSPSLQWQASDNETSNNNLSYKVYFSEVGQDLVLMEETTNISSYDVNGLTVGTSYQWSIWVTDGDNATNVGEVFTFTVN